MRTSNTEQGSYQKEVLVLGKVLVLGFLSCIGIGIAMLYKAVLCYRKFLRFAMLLPCYVML